MDFIKMILRRLLGIEKKELDAEIDDLDDVITKYELLFKRIETICGDNDYSVPGYKIGKIKELCKSREV